MATVNAASAKGAPSRRRLSMRELLRKVRLVSKRRSCYMPPVIGGGDFEAGSGMAQV